MRFEIERKFLVIGDGWRPGRPGTAIRQGYLCAHKAQTVRVRVSGDRAFLTVKGAPKGLARPEFEYEIPAADAHDMLDHLCPRPLVEKTRFEVVHAGIGWVVDVFAGDNEGLVLAEVELAREDQAVELPDWVGEEVTGDPRYLNVNLARHPFRRW